MWYKNTRFGRFSIEFHGFQRFNFATQVTVTAVAVVFCCKITKKSRIQTEKSETEKYDLTGTFGRFSMVSVYELGAELFG